MTTNQKASNPLSWTAGASIRPYSAPAPRAPIVAESQATRPGGTSGVSYFNVTASSWTAGNYGSTGGSMGMNIEQSYRLANELRRLRGRFEDVVSRARQAETLSGLYTPTNQLLRLGDETWSVGNQVEARARELEGHRIGGLNQNLGTGTLTSSRNNGGGGNPGVLPAGPGATPYEALVLDIPFGSQFDREVAARAIATGETYRQTQIRDEIAELAALPGGPQASGTRGQIARLRGEYVAIDPRQRGDLGGTLSVEVRTPFGSAGGSDLALGTGVVTHALADTASADQLQVDEFQVILHDNGKVTLVLPGVIDLSKPHLGYDPETRTARDVDQEAFSSLTTTSLDDNAYAQLVRDFVKEQVEDGVIPRGTDMLIVGHSFGSDTALDLASDPEFNGGLVNVTHVVPTAYHSEPQLKDVVNGTQVGVVQNIYDVAVIGEEIGFGLLGPDRPPIIPLPLVPGLPPVPVPLTEGIGRLGVEGGEAAVSGGAHVVNAFSWVIEKGVEATPGGLEIDIPSVPTDIEFIEDQVTTTDTGLIAEFEGGFSLGGIGHHQDNYIEFLEDPNVDPAVSDFLTDIGAAGYGVDGVSLSVDVSLAEPVFEVPSGPIPVPAPGPVPPSPAVVTPAVVVPEPAPIPEPIRTPEPIEVPEPSPTPQPTATPEPRPTPGPVPAPGPVLAD